MNAFNIAGIELLNTMLLSAESFNQAAQIETAITTLRAEPAVLYNLIAWALENGQDTELVIEPYGYTTAGAPNIEEGAFYTGVDLIGLVQQIEV